MPQPYAWCGISRFRRRRFFGADPGGAVTRDCVGSRLYTPEPARLSVRTDTHAGATVA